MNALIRFHPTGRILWINDIASGIGPYQEANDPFSWNLIDTTNLFAALKRVESSDDDDVDPSGQKRALQIAFELISILPKIKRPTDPAEIEVPPEFALKLGVPRRMNANDWVARFSEVSRIDKLTDFEKACYTTKFTQHV